MPSQRNIELVSQTAERMHSATAIYFTNYTGLAAQDATDLRAKLREADIDYFVVKNTLTRLAAKESGVGDIDEFLDGQVGMAFAKGEPTTPAKLLKDFRKEHDDIPAVLGIYLDGAKIPASRIDELADLPSREVLLTQLLGLLQGPMTTLARTLSSPMTRLGQVLTGLKDTKTS